MSEERRSTLEAFAAIEIERRLQREAEKALEKFRKAASQRPVDDSATQPAAARAAAR